MSLEINGNHLEQYGRRNNLEITGIPDDVSDENLEEKVIQFSVRFMSTSQVLILHHRIGKSRNSSKNQKTKQNKKKQTIV